MTSPQELVARFVDRYGVVPSLFWAPGRVNLIGDHVDYCGGAVLPMPIQFGTTVAVALVPDGRVRAASCNNTERVEFRCGEGVELPIGSWGRFVAGAVGVLADAGIALRGAQLMVSGDIPGSGLSSSASLAVGLLHALATAARQPLEPLALALAAQRIEHDYVGVQCGLMDQAVIALAQPGGALLFDCSTHVYRRVAIDGDSVAVVVADTGRSRQLVQSAYNQRLHETRVAARSLGVDPALLARIDAVTFRHRESTIDDATVRCRARHVIEEAARVTRAAAAIEARDWAAAGHLFCESHASLRDDYEVSCDELDVLVDVLAQQSGCYGARMTGAGFGGCVVALLDAGAVDVAMAEAAAGYTKRFGRSPRWFVARSLGGVRAL